MARRVALTFVIALLSVRAAVAAPLTIQYAATDLAHTVVGEDLWQYSYAVPAVSTTAISEPSSLLLPGSAGRSAMYPRLRLRASR